MNEIYEKLEIIELITHLFSLVSGSFSLKSIIFDKKLAH